MASSRSLQVGFGWFRRGKRPDTRYVEHLGGGAGFWNCMRSLRLGDLCARDDIRRSRTCR